MARQLKVIQVHAPSQWSGSPGLVAGMSGFFFSPAFKCDSAGEMSLVLLGHWKRCFEKGAVPAPGVYLIVSTEGCSAAERPGDSR